MNGLVTVFGGSGFVGRYVVQRLAAAGRPVRAAIRDPGGALFLKPMGNVGRVSLVQANIRDKNSVIAAVEGADAVVNLVGVLAQRGKQKFDSLHHIGAENVAKAAAAAGATRLVHVSAIGADAASPSEYARSNAAGEVAVQRTFPDATILRPSVVFGPEDQFFNRFARLVRLMPALPLIGGGAGPRMQPIYVGDVAQAVLAALSRDDSLGGTYEIGVPEIVTLREILEMAIRGTGRRRLVIPVSWFGGRLVALATVLLPVPSLLRLSFDELKQLRIDSVVSNGERGLAELGVSPTPMAAVVPMMLERYRH